MTGDDRGGIALSDGQVLYSGDGGTGRFTSNALSGASLGWLHDGLFSDLGSGQAYSFSSAGTSAFT